MNKLWIKQIFALPPSEDLVTINGWVRTKRNSKTFSFLEINDGSCLKNLQVIAPNTLSNYEDVIIGLSTGSSVNIEGKLVKSPGKEQAVELQASKITLWGLAASDYPLQKKRHSFEFLREIAHLRPRTNTFGSVARIRHSLSYAIHHFFHERNFLYLHTPIITTSDCEGAGEMFQISTTTDPIHNQNQEQQTKEQAAQEFFGKPAMLTVSGQLEGEIYASALSRIYTFGPTFRAENSNTSRHLAEFWMVEPEVAFYNLDDNMNLAEEMVQFLAKWVLEHDNEDLDFFNLRIDKSVLQVLNTIASCQFERITYTEAIKILEKNNANFEYKVSWGVDIQTEHERFLSEQVFNKPVIVYNYPKGIKAFYMKLNDDEKTVRAMDVLVPRIGELIGGSEREDRYDILAKRIKENDLDPDNYWWYLDLRKYGSVPHAGFGLGFERLILLVTGMKNIRDVIPFPRYPGNALF